MASAAEKGAYYKGRTRRWLEANGYQVWDMEIVRWVTHPDGQRFPIKRDQMGADLGAMNREEIVFVQVKGGVYGRTQLAKARAEFARFAFPPGTKQWVVLWTPRARQPEIVVVSEGPCGAIESRCPVRRESAMPLFGRRVYGATT